MRKIFTLALITLSLNAFSHGDHSMPGALPVAPHGGGLFAVEHKGEDHGGHKHDKKTEEHEELYFEGKVDGSKLLVYPLVLDEVNKTFKKDEASKFTIQKIVLKFPRSKKEVNAKAKSNGDHFVIELPSMRDRRIVAEIEFQKHGENHEVEMQIEIKK